MKKRSLTWFALIALAPVLLIAAVAGLWIYTSASTPQFYLSPESVPSVMRSAPLPTWAPAVAQAQQIVRANVAEQNLPGLSVAVGAGDEIVWAEGFGWADLGSHELDFTGQLALDKVMQATDKRVGVSPDTRFRIVGVSMVLTSAAVGLLLEDGRLKLDDEIHTHVPAFPKKPWPVTMRQLMAHQAGVPYGDGEEVPQCDRTVDGLKLDNFAERPLKFEPGTQYRYSPYGWILVSAAVDAAANEPFFTFMRDKILAPLGMRDTMPDSLKEPIPNRATSYYPRFAADPGYGPDLTGKVDHSCWSGAGAYLSTPSDLVRFGLAMNSAKVLQPATVKLLQTPQRLTSGEETVSGLGWDVKTATLSGESTRMASQHDTQSAGGSTSLITFPDRGLAVAVTTNITFAKTELLAMKIAEVFAEQMRARR